MGDDSGSGPQEVLVIDCGSGGTRAWRRAGGGFERLPWPGGERAPVLSRALLSEDGRAAFARAVGQLPGRCIVGATAGLRHALEVGDVCDEHLEHFRQLLPAGAELRILTPLEEARFECSAMRRHCRPTDGMLSMGGKSMQIACGDQLFSLPFSMHFGRDILDSREGSWEERLARCTSEYRRRVAEEKERQGLKLSGHFVCVTDTVLLARELCLQDKKLAAEEVAELLARRAAELPEALADRELVHAARVVLLQALFSQVFLGCSVIFRSDFTVSWTAGFFAELETSN